MPDMYSFRCVRVHVKANFTISVFITRQEAYVECWICIVTDVSTSMQKLHDVLHGGFFERGLLSKTENDTRLVRRWEFNRGNMVI